MTQKNKAGFLAYAATPLMTSTVFIIAICVFVFIFKENFPVPIFIIFMVINLLFMSLYAIFPMRFKNIARYVSMILIGGFLTFSAIAFGGNYQLESFFFHILAGVFGGVFINYANGKIIGPLLAGRNWCGWACWTTMILDLLPYKQSKGWVKSKPTKYKYLHFALSFILVVILYFGFNHIIHNPKPTAENPGTMTAVYWFIFGNALYYAVGIFMAIKLKDNRAFCKYLCPVSIFLKFSNNFSLLKIKGNKDKCNNCGKCTDNCIMNIDIPAYIKVNERVKANECVMCMKCIATCPEAALKASLGLDVSRECKVKTG